MICPECYLLFIARHYFYMKSVQYEKLIGRSFGLIIGQLMRKPDVFHFWDWQRLTHPLLPEVSKRQMWIFLCFLQSSEGSYKSAHEIFIDKGSICRRLFLMLVTTSKTDEPLLVHVTGCSIGPMCPTASLNYTQPFPKTTTWNYAWNIPLSLLNRTELWNRFAGGAKQEGSTTTC